MFLAHKIQNSSMFSANVVNVHVKLTILNAQNTINKTYEHESSKECEDVAGD